MLRLIIVALLASLAVALLQRFISRLRLGNQSPAHQASKKPEEKISKCETCGLHIPETSGIWYQEKFFCSNDHKVSFIEAQSKEQD